MSTRGAHFLSEALERGRARGMGMAKGQRGGRAADGGTRGGPAKGGTGGVPAKAAREEPRRRAARGGVPAEGSTGGVPAEDGTRGAPAEKHRHSRLPAGRSCSRADASPPKPIPGSIFRLFHVKQCRSRASSTYTHNPKQESNCTPYFNPRPVEKRDVQWKLPRLRAFLRALRRFSVSCEE